MQEPTERALTPELAEAYQRLTAAGVPAGPPAWTAAQVVVDARREQLEADRQLVRFRTVPEVLQALKAGLLELEEARPFLGLPRRPQDPLARLWRWLGGR